MALKRFVEDMGIHSMLKHMCLSIECSMYQNTIIPISTLLDTTAHARRSGRSAKLEITNRQLFVKRAHQLRSWRFVISNFALRPDLRACAVVSKRVLIQVTLFGMHHYSHVLPTDYNPYSANLAGVHHRSHVPSQSFSKAVVLTVAVKVLGMLQHTNPLSLN